MLGISVYSMGQVRKSEHYVGMVVDKSGKSWLESCADFKAEG